MVVLAQFQTDDDIKNNITRGFHSCASEKAIHGLIREFTDAHEYPLAGQIKDGIFRQNNVHFNT